MNRRQWAMLVWKELEEDRWFFYAGAVALVVLPLYASVFSLGAPFLYLTALLLGSLLAVLVGVGTACRDLRGGVETFWRSRPIDPRRWLAIKFILGLLVVEAIHALALGGQIALCLYGFGEGLGQVSSFIAALIFHGLTLALVYSVAFLLAALIRRAVPAAILSLAAVLLIYFIPILFSSLQWLSIYNLVYMAGGTRWEMEFGNAHVIAWLIAFTVFMAGGALVLGLLACEAVRRDWRLRINAQLMAWTLGGVTLLLFASGAKQLGTNLRVERVINLNSPGQRGMRYAIRALTADQRTIVEIETCLLEHVNGHAGGDTCTQWAWWAPASITFAPFDGDHDQLIDFYAELATAKQFPFLCRLTGASLAWNPEVPNRIYALVNGWSNAGKSIDSILAVCDFQGQEIQQLDLPTDPEAGHTFEYQYMFFNQGRLYCYPGCWNYGWQYSGGAVKPKPLPMLVISLADPDHPRIERAMARRWLDSLDPELSRLHSAGDKLAIALPDIPGWSNRQKLEARMGQEGRASLEGDLLVSKANPSPWGEYSPPEIWHLTELKNDLAIFSWVGRAEYSPLEQLTQGMGLAPARNSPFPSGNEILLHDQRIYVVQEDINMGVKVYDVYDPQHPREVGHFSAPNENIFSLALAPLPHGRVLVMGSHLYVLDPPR